MGEGTCKEETYIDFQQLHLQNMSVPTFFTIGDNDWNDCANPREALSFWKKYVLPIESQFSNLTFDVSRQVHQEENFAFELHSVMYIGLNMVGGRMLNRTIWKEKL